MKMPFYNATTSIDAFFELLRLANPDMSELITKDSVDIGSPIVLDPVVGSLNTEITLTPKEGFTDLVGSATLRYTRLTLSYLVQSSGGVNNTVRKIYGSVADTDVNGELPISAAYRSKIAERLGLIWEGTGEFTLSSLLSDYTNTQLNLTLSAVPSNLCYEGSCVFNLGSNTSQVIDNVLSSKVLADDLSLSENPDVFYKLLAIRPTDAYIAAFRTAFGTGDTFAATTITAGHQPFFDVVNTLTGLNLRADVAFGATAYAIGGQTIAKQLPSSASLQLRYGGANVDALINSRFKTLLGGKWARVAIVGGTYTGWQKTQFILPLFLVN